MCAESQFMLVQQAGSQPVCPIPGKVFHSLQSVCFAYTHACVCVNVCVCVCEKALEQEDNESGIASSSFRYCSGLVSEGLHVCQNIDNTTFRATRET